MTLRFLKRRPQFVKVGGTALLAASAGIGTCAGQTSQNATDSPSSGDVKVSGSLRSRVEVWNWFEGNGNNQYAFSDSIFRLSFTGVQERYDWKLELAAPILLGLPSNSTVPGPQGAMG